MPIDLFTPQVPADKQHPIFQRILAPQYAPERAVLQSWATGFADRDGKFVQEFQRTFESSMWELYLNAALAEFGFTPNMTFNAPDFVIDSPIRFSIEAAIAAPAHGGAPAFNYDPRSIPDDFTQFNIESTIRICNSFDAKVKRYRKYYSGLPQAKDQPFVIAIASFDRPYAHFAAGRSILAAFYGIYHDEAATPKGANKVVSYNVDAAPKSESTNIPLGLFCDERHAEVSAVIYSALATWGKIRALADSPDAMSTYTTFHPNEHSIKPKMRVAQKKEYYEHLLDGLYVLHNPYAKHPIPRGTLSHPRIAEFHVATDGELIESYPEDFLLLRSLNTVLPS